MMTETMFLFISFLLGLLVLVYFFSDLVNDLVQSRKVVMINDIAILKTDIKFLRLDEEKAFEKYTFYKMHVESWQNDGEIAYQSRYALQKNKYDSWIEEEKNKLEKLKFSQKKAMNIFLLNKVFDQLNEKLLNSKESLFKSDFIAKINEI